MKVVSLKENMNQWKIARPMGIFRSSVQVIQKTECVLSANKIGRYQNLDKRDFCINIIYRRFYWSHDFFVLMLFSTIILFRKIVRISVGNPKLIARK